MITKYKAWIPHLKKIHNIVTMRFNLDTFEPESVCIDFDRTWHRDFELLQYTGMKDLNGVEIYEGDVLEAHEGPWAVIYHINMFAMKNESGLMMFGGWYTSDVVEVIGNIYENPELLEDNA